MRRALSLGLIAFALAAGAASQGTSGSADRFLALGISQFNDGNFEDAAFSLDTAIRSLSAQPARTKELTQAYVYLGAAYVGLENEDAAKGKFRKALELEPAFRLSHEQFPPRVLKLFDEEVARHVAGRKKRGAKRFLAMGGVGAAAAVGVAAATRTETLPLNRPPSVGFSFTPEGHAISNVTIVTFAATAADADGDPIELNWDFGDGSTATGPTVTHVFARDGCLSVRVAASDGKGGTTASRHGVASGSLAGRWQSNYTTDKWQDFDCSHAGEAFACRAANVERSWLPIEARGTLRNPRLVQLVLFRGPDAKFVPRVETCAGELSADLRSLRCVTTTGGFGLGRPYADPFQNCR